MLSAIPLMVLASMSILPVTSRLSLPFFANDIVDSTLRVASRVVLRVLSSVLS